MTGTPKTFRMPDSVLLFANPYEDLRVVDHARELVVRPADETMPNKGRFSLPSLSPDGKLVAWGFVAAMKPDTSSLERARFSLGVYSIGGQRWRTYGDFDWIGAAAFSLDSSKVAFTVQQDQQNERSIRMLDIFSGTISRVRFSMPVPEAILGVGDISWAPDGEKIAIRAERGEKRLICIVDLKTADVHVLGEGGLPEWSPNGEWIAYSNGYDLWVSDPDGSGARKVAKVGGGFWNPKYVHWALVWSPDSRSILVNVGRGEEGWNDVFLVELDTGKRTRKSRNGAAVFGWAKSANRCILPPAGAGPIP